MSAGCLVLWAYQVVVVVDVDNQSEGSSQKTE
jgi:hypothetical protein